MTVQGASPNAALPIHTGRTESNKPAGRIERTVLGLSSSNSSNVPDGASPQLWAMLTDEERAFFLQHMPNAMTYGPAKPPSVDVAAPRGNHIDARA